MTHISHDEAISMMVINKTIKSNMGCVTSWIIRPVTGRPYRISYLASRGEFFKGKVGTVRVQVA